MSRVEVVRVKAVRSLVRPKGPGPCAVVVIAGTRGVVKAAQDNGWVVVEWDIAVLGKDNLAKAGVEPNWVVDDVDANDLEVAM